MIKITIPGEPVPQGRPRFARVGHRVMTHDPVKSKNYKQVVALEAKRQYKKAPSDKALQVTINVYRPIQKSISKKERGLRLNGSHRPVVKGDIDNYFKAVTDACTGILWVDDAQIVSMHADKYYSADPHVELVVEELEETE